MKLRSCVKATMNTWAVIGLSVLSGCGETGAKQTQVVSTMSAAATPSEDFTLEVLRQYNGARATAGFLRVNEKIICYTLERPWQDNQKNISSIPAGTYPGILRYDHKDHWRIELADVPNRTNVQIHIGNEPDETKGCILVGMKINKELNRLSQSAEAYAELKKLFYETTEPTSTPNKGIKVKVEDAGPGG